MMDARPEHKRASLGQRQTFFFGNRFHKVYAYGSHNTLSTKIQYNLDSLASGHKTHTNNSVRSAALVGRGKSKQKFLIDSISRLVDNNSLVWYFLSDY